MRWKEINIEKYQHTCAWNNLIENEYTQVRPTWKTYLINWNLMHNQEQAKVPESCV